MFVPPVAASRRCSIDALCFCSEHELFTVYVLCESVSLAFSFAAFLFHPKSPHTAGNPVGIYTPAGINITVSAPEKMLDVYMQSYTKNMYIFLC